MGVFGRFKKHEEHEQSSAPAPQQDMSASQDMPEPTPSPSPQTQIPLPNDVPSPQEQSQIPLNEPTPAPQTSSMPPAQSMPIPDTSSAPVAPEDMQFDPVAQSPAETPASNQDNPLDHPVPLPEHFELPPSYGQAPESIPQRDEAPQQQQTESLEDESEPVHMQGKIHVPEPKAEELIVSEVYVEREHFIELLSALHVSRHELEHNLSSNVNFDQTEKKIQEHLAKLHDTLDKMQQNTLHIENELARQQG